MPSKLRYCLAIERPSGEQLFYYGRQALNILAKQVLLAPAEADACKKLRGLEKIQFLFKRLPLKKKALKVFREHRNCPVAQSLYLQLLRNSGVRMNARRLVVKWAMLRPAARRVAEIVRERAERDWRHTYRW
jgi:hypothetical protein